jgi:hypothetical protein
LNLNVQLPCPRNTKKRNTGEEKTLDQLLWYLMAVDNEIKERTKQNEDMSGDLFYPGNNSAPNVYYRRLGENCWYPRKEQ